MRSQALNLYPVSSISPNAESESIEQDRKRKPTWLAIQRAWLELATPLCKPRRTSPAPACRYSRSIVESPVSFSLAILKIRIYVADYVLSKVCDLTHQFEFK